MGLSKQNLRSGEFANYFTELSQSFVDIRIVLFIYHSLLYTLQTLEGHAQNISAVTFHPELPIILTGSEDGTFGVWHANTYRWRLRFTILSQTIILQGWVSDVPLFIFFPMR